MVLTEFLPPNTSYDPSNTGWVQITPFQYQYTVGNLAVGASGSKTFKVILNSPVPAGVTEIADTVTIADDGANGPDLNPADNTAAATNPVNAAPDLMVTKTDFGMQTVAGGIARYTLTYSNIGNQDATGVILTELLPANTAFNAAQSSPGWVLDGSHYELVIGSVPANTSGTAVFAVTVAIPLPIGVTQIDNTATIEDDASGGTDPNLANNTATDSTPIIPVVGGNLPADLRITKNDGVTTIAPGNALTYTIVVTNTGPGAATGVTVADTFPASLTGVTWTAAGSGGATGFTASGSGNINDTSVNVPVGGRITYTVHATLSPSAAGSLVNTATVNKIGLIDLDLSNNTATDTDAILSPADLAVTKTFVRTVDADGSGSTTAGDTGQFTVTVTNNGPFGATGVALTDLLPAGFSYVSDDAPANGQTYTLGTGLWTIGNLANGASTVLHITATVNPGGPYTNTASVSASDNPDPNPANNQASVTPPVAPVSDLSLAKLLMSYVDNDGSGNLSGGDRVTFTLNLTNSGPNPATGVTVKDQLPAGYTYVSDTGGGAYFFPTGIWTVGTLNTLATASLSITATVNAGFDPASGAYANYAQVWSSNNFDPDSTPADNSTNQDDDATATPLISDLSLAKSIALAPGGDLDSTGGMSHGDRVIFTITVSNAGPDIATGVVIRDAIPAGYTYVSNDGGAGYSAGMLTWPASPAASRSVPRSRRSCTSRPRSSAGRRLRRIPTPPRSSRPPTSIRTARPATIRPRARTTTPRPPRRWPT